MLREQKIEHESNADPDSATAPFNDRSLISNRQLREAFLSPQMEGYFRKNLPEVPATEILVRIEEALKFLNMATYCEGNIPVSQEIDDIWHYWILETKEYAKLCASLEGREFIHHCSNAYAESDTDATVTPANTLEQDVVMLGNYVRNYGPFEGNRIKYWLLANHLVNKSGMTIDQLNSWLVSGTTGMGNAPSATSSEGQTEPRTWHRTD